jgi:tetratricopeptide (TPR) repeat protein
MANPPFHLDETMAAGLAANTLPGLERNRAVRHLLSGCAECRAAVQRIFQPGEWPAHEALAPLAEIGATLRAASKEMGLASGELLWLEVERRKAKERLAFLRGSPKHHTFGLFEAGLAACRRLVQSRPDEAVEVAQLLGCLAEMICPSVKGQQALRFDWRAAAAMVLARARRAAGDFRGAESALDVAAAFLEMGSRDEVDQAFYHLERGRLLADLGHFEEAVNILDRAAALFRFAGDRNSEGKVQLQQAAIFRITEPARAYELAEDGLTKISKDDSETLAEVSAHYTMAYCLAEMGGADEADSIIATYTYLIERQAAAAQMSFEWLQARIRFQQGRRAEAEQVLREVQGWYLEHNFRFEAVLTSIDLTEMMYQDDRTGEALYLVSAVLPILQSWGLHRDCLAVVARLGEALEEAAVEEETFRTATDALHRAWHRNGAAPLPNY